MSLVGKWFSEGEEACYQEMEKLPDRVELLMSKKEFMEKKIEQELLVVKKNSRINRPVAVQALRRKKWYEKHLKYIDRAVEALRSAHEHIDVVNKLSDLIKDIAEEQEGTQDTPDSLHTTVCFGVEYDEDELLAELERLEKNLVESLFESDKVEERLSCPKLSPTASPSHPAKTEEDEIEDELEYLRRWVNELS